MTRMPHPALLWTANLLVPGTGLVLLGHLGLGLLLGVSWLLALSGVLLATLVWPDAAGTTAARGGVVAAAGIVYVLVQWVHTLRCRRMRRHLASDDRDAIFKKALVATLQGRLDDAEGACNALLRADPDDVEAALHLGTLALRRGRREAALRHLRRARYLDADGRWDFEIGRELAALRKSGRPDDASSDATAHGDSEEPPGSARPSRVGDSPENPLTALLSGF